MRITAIGGATIDTIVENGQHSLLSGSKLDVESIEVGVGGGAVNASLAFSACGASVRIVCAVGEDYEAKWVRAVLASEAIDVSLVQTVFGQPTGRAVVHLESTSEVKIFAVRGASLHVKPARGLSAIEEADMLYVSALSDFAESELAALLHQVGNTRLKFVINPSGRQLDAYTIALERILTRADLVSVNEAEVRVWAARVGATLPLDLSMDVESWLSQLRRHSRQAVLVTTGAKGAIFHDGVRVHLLGAQEIPVRSSLGAGDAFAAVLAYHWAAGCTAGDALNHARCYCAKVLQVLTANLGGAKPELVVSP